MPAFFGVSLRHHFWTTSTDITSEQPAQCKLNRTLHVKCSTFACTRSAEQILLGPIKTCMGAHNRALNWGFLPKCSSWGRSGCWHVDAEPFTFSFCAVKLQLNVALHGEVRRRDPFREKFARLGENILREISFASHRAKEGTSEATVTQM